MFSVKFILSVKGQAKWFGVFISFEVEIKSTLLCGFKRVQYSVGP